MPREVRIIGGAWKRSKLPVLDRPGLRPTPDRVRETLFNWLGQDLSGLACLDLYAGSGALGFEAASRGAARVVMVESDRPTLRALEASRAALNALQVEIIGGTAAAYLERAHERFDVVFLDPPFRQNAVPDLLPLLPGLLNATARVYAEAAGPVHAPPGWREAKRARTGGVSYQLFEREQNDSSGVPRNV
ncbi:MAG: 16S rRNA (guanine(966)-N(2))-methyltransferase RsmD [Burkholderiales bacterium]